MTIEVRLLGRFVALRVSTLNKQETEALPAHSPDGLR